MVQQLPFPEEFNNTDVIVLVSSKNNTGSGRFDEATFIQGCSRGGGWQIQYKDTDRHGDEIYNITLGNRRCILYKNQASAKVLRKAREKAVRSTPHAKGRPNSQDELVREAFSKLHFVKKVVDDDDDVSYYHVVFDDNHVATVTNQKAFTDDRTEFVPYVDTTNEDSDEDDEDAKEAGGTKPEDSDDDDSKKRGTKPEDSDDDSEEEDDDVLITCPSCGHPNDPTNTSGEPRKRCAGPSGCNKYLPGQDPVKRGCGVARKRKGGKGGGKKELMAEDSDSGSEDDDDVRDQLVELEGKYEELQYDYGKLEVEKKELERKNGELNRKKRTDERSMEKLNAENEKLKKDMDAEHVYHQSLQKQSSEREEKLEKQIEQLQEQLQQQKQPSEQQQDFLSLFQQLQPLPLEEHPQQQSITELLKQQNERQKQAIIGMLRMIISNCGSDNDKDDDMDMMEKMKSKYQNIDGPAAKILYALVQLAQEEKYSLLEGVLEEELKDLDKFIPELKQLQQKVVKEENELNARVALCAQLESGKGGLTAEERAGLLKKCEADTAKAKDEYNTKEATVRNHHKRIANEMEEMNEDATEYTEWANISKDTPEAKRAKWEKRLEFDTWKGKRLSMDETE